MEHTRLKNCCKMLGTSFQRENAVSHAQGTFRITLSASRRHTSIAPYVDMKKLFVNMFAYPLNMLPTQGKYVFIQLMQNVLVPRKSMIKPIVLESIYYFKIYVHTSDNFSISEKNS